MPQVSDNFGPLYQSIVLDANGGGAVSFQATGSNIRLTNVTFFVSSSSNQAQVAIYKGQVAPGNRVFNSNSGSTGASATGNIDLFDGETCFVVWTGGDVGATATATFVGGKIPFGEIKPSTLVSQEPIAAGDGSLIFPALKSPDFITGVSGWRVGRDGSAEFNEVDVRGSVTAVGLGGGYAELNNFAQFAGLELMPNFKFAGENPGRVYAFNEVSGDAIPTLTLQSPSTALGDNSNIYVMGDSENGITNSQIIFLSKRFFFTDDLVEMFPWPGRWSDQLAANAAGITSTTVTPLLTVTLPGAGKYTFECDLVMTVTGAVSRPGFALGGTCTPSDWSWISESVHYNTATGSQAFRDNGTTFVSTGVSLVNSDWTTTSGFSWSRVIGTINVTAGGTLTFGVSRATGTGTINVRQGSIARVQYEG